MGPADPDRGAGEGGFWVSREQQHIAGAGVGAVEEKARDLNVSWATSSCGIAPPIYPLWGTIKHHATQRGQTAPCPSLGSISRTPGGDRLNPGLSVGSAALYANFANKFSILQDGCADNGRYHTQESTRPAGPPANGSRGSCSMPPALLARKRNASATNVEVIHGRGRLSQCPGIDARHISRTRRAAAASAAAISFALCSTAAISE